MPGTFDEIGGGTAEPLETPEERKRRVKRERQRANERRYEQSERGKATRAARDATPELHQADLAKNAEYHRGHREGGRTNEAKYRASPGGKEKRRLWARTQREAAKAEESAFLGGTTRSRPKARPARMPWLIRQAPQTPEERAAANRAMIEQMRAREATKHKGPEGPKAHWWWRKL